jgi:hypothetical protein
MYAMFPMSSFHFRKRKLLLIKFPKNHKSHALRKDRMPHCSC